MIKLITSLDGSTDLHLDAATAGYLSHAIAVARPAGSHEAVTHDGIVRVHVHATAATPKPAHEPVEAK